MAPLELTEQAQPFTVDEWREGMERGGRAAECSIDYTKIRCSSCCCYYYFEYWVLAIDLDRTV